MPINLSYIKSKLPNDFVQMLYETFNAGTADGILTAYGKNRVTSGRINTLKTDGKYSIDEILSIFQKSESKVQKHFIPNMLVFPDTTEHSLLKHPLIQDGYIYLQSLSSSIPAILLQPSPHSKVCDIAAAPGGKTSQCAAIMKNTGKITAIEPDFIRCERLKHNLNKLGVTNTDVVQERSEIFLSEKYSEKYIEQGNKSVPYDFVIADVPCSGEGTVNFPRKQFLQKWSLTAVLKYQKLQKSLLTAALKRTKPGGVVVYSTCTLNRMENEEVVTDALQKGGCKCLQFPFFIQSIPNKQLIQKKNGLIALQIFPSELMEGFFVSILKKEL